MSGFTQNKWKHRGTKIIPVDIINKSENHRVMVEMPKPFPTNFLPISSLNMRTIKTKVSQHDPFYVEAHEMNAYREVTQKQVEIMSQKFQNSKFTIDIPFNFISRESSKTFFTLQLEGGRAVMQTLDGVLTCDEWILDKSGVNLSLKQLLKFQQIMNDTRKRFKPTEQEIDIMYDKNGQFIGSND